MLPNEALLPSVFKALFDKFGWKKLYTIAEDNALFTVVGRCWTTQCMLM